MSSPLQSTHLDPTAHVDGSHTLPDARAGSRRWVRRAVGTVALALAAAAAGQALALAVVSAAEAATPAVTAAKLKSGFKKSSGQTLVVDKLRSSTGRYVAFNLGVETPDRKARYGTFTVYLVTGADVEGVVGGLLADPHTGTVGTPAAGGLYWEKGKTIYGDAYWLAKKRYGSNIVLWWTGEKPVKKTEASFTTLHKALSAVVKAR